MLKNNTNSTPGKTKSSTDSMNDVAMEDADGEKEKLIVEAYMPSDPGPYPQDQPRQNSFRFTPYRQCTCHLETFEKLLLL